MKIVKNILIALVISTILYLLMLFFFIWFGDRNSVIDVDDNSPYYEKIKEITGNAKNGTNEQDLQELEILTEKHNQFVKIQIEKGKAKALSVAKERWKVYLKLLWALFCIVFIVVLFYLQRSNSGQE